MGELKKRYRYYMLMRPLGPGTAPRGIVDWGKLDPNVLIESIGHHAWAWIEYDHPLTIEEVRDYELAPAFVGT